MDDEKFYRNITRINICFVIQRYEYDFQITKESYEDSFLSFEEIVKNYVEDSIHQMYEICADTKYVIYVRVNGEWFDEYTYVRINRGIHAGSFERIIDEDEDDS